MLKLASNIYTDEWGGYSGLKKSYNHGVVNHGGGEYVNGVIHTNTVEGFWSLLKRGIIGIYHHVSPKHLDRYCDEFVFRYNTKDASQQQRLDIAIAQSEGKRLKYKQLIA